MKPTKKRNPDNDIGDLGFEEALARLLQIDHDELKDSQSRIEQDDDNVREYVRERKESIRKGARRTGKRFRL